MNDVAVSSKQKLHLDYSLCVSINLLLKQPLLFNSVLWGRSNSLHPFHFLSDIFLHFPFIFLREPFSAFFFVNSPQGKIFLTSAQNERKRGRKNEGLCRRRCNWGNKNQVATSHQLLFTFRILHKHLWKKVQLKEQNHVATFLKSIFVGEESVQKCGANIVSTQSDELYDFQGAEVHTT